MVCLSQNPRFNSLGAGSIWKSGGREAKNQPSCRLPDFPTPDFLTSSPLALAILLCVNTCKGARYADLDADLNLHIGCRDRSGGGARDHHRESVGRQRETGSHALTGWIKERLAAKDCDCDSQARRPEREPTREEEKAQRADEEVRECVARLREKESKLADISRQIRDIRKLTSMQPIRKFARFSVQLLKHTD